MSDYPADFLMKLKYEANRNQSSFSEQFILFGIDSGYSPEFVVFCFSNQGKERSCSEMADVCRKMLVHECVK